MVRTFSLLEAQAPVTITREAQMIEPPDDRARTLAKEALAQIKRLEDLGRLVGEDVTKAQEWAISTVIRNYFIERMEAR